MSDEEAKRVARESADKAREAAEATERRRRQQALAEAFDPTAAMLAAISGGRHGSERLRGGAVTVVPSLEDRMLAAVEAGVAAYRETAEERTTRRPPQQIAADLHEMAQRVERGY